MKKLMSFVFIVLFLTCAGELFAQRRYADYGGTAYGNTFGTGGYSAGRGYHGMVEGGAGFDLYQFNGTAFVSTTHGYNLNPYFFLGGGVGYFYGSYYDYFNNGFDMHQFRCFADIRGYLLNKRVTPFIGCKGGFCTPCYSMPMSPYISTSLGVRWMLKNCSALNFSVEADSGVHWYIGALFFRIGFEFGR